jgi:hypothetical protein
MDAIIETFKGVLSILGIDGEIAVKGKGLAVEAGGDKSQKDGRGADERENGEATLVCKGDDLCTRVGDGGTTGIGEEGDGKVEVKWSQERRDIGDGSVLIKHEESKVVNRKVGMHESEKASGGANVFDDEMADRQEDSCVMRG